LKPKKRTSSCKRRYRKSLIGTFTLFLLSFYSWLGTQLTKVELPDAGHPTLLYSTEMKDDLGHTLGAAIANAKESVTLVIYALTDRGMIEKLNTKSQEGVATTVICDAKASPQIENRLDKSIVLVKRFLMGLMHQKILIIDNKQTWIGSANLSGESLRHHGNLVAAIESPSLAAMATAKAFSLKAYERTSTFPTSTFPVGGQAVELWFLPDNSGAIQRLVQLIRAAEKTIRIGMFTWTRKDLAQEIITAHKRGIKVDIAIDKGTSAGASENIVKMLKKHKIPVRTNNGSQLLHHKFMIIDDKILVNGSANWTLSAFEKNDDCFFVLNNLNEEQSSFLNTMWQKITTNSSPAR
jgi:cardiolipin synthase